MKQAAGPVRLQFDTLAQQQQADTLGMWTFLASEVLFFGGLFLAYSVYRWFNPAVFPAASRELNLAAGTLNTAILLSSSLCAALADRFLELGKRKHAQALLALTVLLGLAFLAVKGYEYYQEYRHHLIPFIDRPFEWQGENPNGARLFFNLYFVMTGLHALHLFIGCALFCAVIAIARRSRDLPRLRMQVSLAALYWHFVDVVWVFLFPLLYLAR